MSGFTTSQVLTPPELPPYLESVHKLNPIAGAPSDDEMIAIHAVIRVANRVVDVQGVGDSLLLAQLSEHLFNAQIARYKSKYLRAVFPENTTYKPPALPPHVPVNLEPVTGAPSDETIIRVQKAIRSYQQFSDVPSMFDPHVGMELSQHLFDIQMARYTQFACQRVVPQTPNTAMSTNSTRAIDEVTEAEDMNNAGTGATAAITRIQQFTPSLDTQELMERSNQLAERFNQVVERLDQVVQTVCRPAEPSNQLVERFNQLLDRFTQLTERSSQPVERVNEMVEKSKQLTERVNRLAEQLNQSPSADYQRGVQSTERIGDILTNINGVLVGIQHAINNRNNTIKALDCLVNEKGQTPGISLTTAGKTIGWFTDTHVSPIHRLPVVINGASQVPLVPDSWLGKFLCFYGIGDDLCKDTDPTLKEGKESEARARLSKYLSSCLG